MTTFQTPGVPARLFDLNFQRAVKLILKHEGGYANDPLDPGGETNYGISKRSYPALDIKALTADDASAIYYRDYWLAVRGPELPWPIALVTFDCAVNCGTGAAIHFLQHALGVAADGALGPVTLGAVNAAADPEAVASRISRHRLIYHAADVRWPLYCASWVQRTLDTMLVAARYEGPP